MIYICVHRTTNPEIRVSILIDVVYGIIPVSVIAYVILPEPIPVVTVDAVKRCKPHHTPRIAAYATYIVVTYAVAHIQVMEMKVRISLHPTIAKHGQQNYCQQNTLFHHFLYFLLITKLAKKISSATFIIILYITFW